MATLLKSIYVDRDDFDADHYADFMRDTHRSRLTLDQLDIAQRQLRTKEKLLSRIHDLKMKEYTRVKNEFIRKVEQDSRVSNLPIVKEKLKGERRKHVQTSPPPLSVSNEDSQETTAPTTSEPDEQPQPSEKHSKTTTKPDSPRTQRLKVNLNKFNNTNALLI